MGRVTEMKSWGLDLSVRPVEQFSKGFGTGLVYAGLVVLLCLAIATRTGVLDILAAMGAPVLLSMSDRVLSSLASPAPREARH